MPQASVRRIQDPVHGLMELRGLERVVIEVLRTRELQRMRRIRQMGLSHLVFPGAEHSRLVHLLGTAQVAIRFAKRLAEDARTFLSDVLSPDPESIRDLAIAALTHDIGHGPLSHAWEEEIIGPGYSRSAWSRSLGVDDSTLPPVMTWHELVGHALLAWEDGELHQLLELYSEGFSGRIRQMHLGVHYVPYLPRLLNSDVDADRSDYLLRDAHYCGVTYGKYDIDWLIATCRIGTTPQGLVVGFDSYKGLRVVEQFLSARTAMHDMVYHHKTIRSVEGMVGKLLNRLKGIPDSSGALIGAGPVAAPFRKVFDGDPLGPEEIITLDDYALWMLIDYIAALDPVRFDVTACDLASRIVRRDLFKAVPLPTEKVRDFLRDDSKKQHLLELIGGVVPGEPSYYFFRDDAEFSALTTSEDKTGYLVDVANERQATPIGRERSLVHFVDSPRVITRYFTPREAVDDIEKLIRTY